MPYVKKSEHVRLALPSDPAYWVEIVPVLNYGARQRRLNRVLRVHLAAEAGVETPAQTEIELGTMNLATLVEAIVAWNLDDADGRALPITEAVISEHLDPDDAEFLLAEINRRNAPATPSAPGKKR